jgi:hypothetical protein
LQFSGNYINFAETEDPTNASHLKHHFSDTEYILRTG